MLSDDRMIMLLGILICL